MRNSTRKHAQNITVKSRLHTLETSYAKSLVAGKKEDAAKATAKEPAKDTAKPAGQ